MDLEKFNSLDENLKNKIVIHNQYYECILDIFYKKKYIPIFVREYVINLIDILAEDKNLIDIINSYSQIHTDISDIERKNIYNILLKWKNIILDYGNKKKNNLFLINNQLNPVFVKILEKINLYYKFSLSYPSPQGIIKNKIIITGPPTKEEFINKLQEYIELNYEDLEFIDYHQGKRVDQ